MLLPRVASAGLRDEDVSDDIGQWRVRVFAMLLPVVLVLGMTAAVPSIAAAIAQGEWAVVVIDVVALGWLFAIWRMAHLAYTVRALQFLAVLFLVSLSLMMAVGPIGLNYLMAPPVMAVILLGMTPAILTLALSCACIVWLGVHGYAKLYLPGVGLDPLLSSLLVALNFSCVGALVTVTCGTLLKGLSRSLSDAHGSAASLAARQAELHALNDELRLTSEAVARLNDMVVIARLVDTAGAQQPIIFANDAFARRTGYARDEIVGRGVHVLFGTHSEAAALQRLQEAITRKEPASAELLQTTRSGEPYWVHLDMVPFAGDSGAATHWVLVGRDITEQKNAADAIHRLAFYDVLTGLPNRRLLVDRVAALLDGADGHGAVLYVDLDNFKTINDARGHAIGDGLLRLTTARLEAIVAGRGLVARIGGDEFVVLLDALGGDPAAATGEALAVAEAIRAALACDMDLEGQRYHASASIGVALALPGHSHGHDHGAAPGAQTVHDLLRQADIAMYHAKAQGRNGVALFEAHMLREAERKLALERDLAQALDNGELALHLQLQVDGAGDPHGAELLMRWRRADGSAVPPDVFIPVAESSGLIVPLGEWALRQACLAWHALAAAGRALPLSVNVSPVQFRQADFVARVAAILDETGVPPGQLIFEVTEGLLVDRLDQTIERMHELAALGIRISVDDFGTGYSSLAYLTRMPLYELKIDKSFIRETPHDKNGTAIVQSILAMAGHLGLRVVAEGVETADQADYLARHGNACMQGWLFHRPAPLEQVLGHLAAHPAGAAGSAAVPA